MHKLPLSFFLSFYLSSCFSTENKKIEMESATVIDPVTKQMTEYSYYRDLNGNVILHGIYAIYPHNSNKGVGYTYEHGRLLGVGEATVHYSNNP
jgi:hypothetical protein